MPDVLVTGGSRGIGLGIAAHLAKGGRDVVVVARRAGAAFERAAQECPRGSLRFHAADLADIAQLPALARKLAREFGATAALVNNAGAGSAGLLATMPDRAIEDLVRLNVTSPLVLTKHLVRGMMAAGQGRIVNIASIVAFSGYKGLAAYAATKSALLGFTRALARELGPLGITVNAIAPGFVDTELTQSLTSAQREQIVRRSPLKTLVEPSDIAHAVEFLLGDGARHLTGVVLAVDAGATA